MSNEWNRVRRFRSVFWLLAVVTVCLVAAGCGDSSSSTGDITVSAASSLTAGDAVAAIAYVTDAKSAGAAAATVEIPSTQNVLATYPIAGLKASSKQDTVQRFIDFVLSPEGQSTLQSFGFLPPS